MTARADERTAPAYIHAFDGGEWSYYVSGHDPDELHVIDNPDSLDYEKLWMRPIPASQANDHGVCDDDPDDTVLRDGETGRFVARVIWIECKEGERDAVAYMGCRYKPEDSRG